MHDVLLLAFAKYPHYKNVTISEHVLESLLIDGVPSEMMTIGSVCESVPDEITSAHL